MPRTQAATRLDRARDELFKHVIRCEVLKASMPDRHSWMDETIVYLAERYPELGDSDLSKLDTMGRRFIMAAIPHGAHATAINREEWQN